MKQEIKIDGIKKIINLGKDDLDESDFKEGMLRDIEVFIYAYEQGCYDGSGFAAWRNKKKEWAYTGLGHCSCYGPMESVHGADIAKFKVEEIIKIAKNYNEEGELVANYLTKNYD